MSRLPFLLLALLGTALSAAIVLQLDPVDETTVALPEAAPRRAATEFGTVSPEPSGRAEQWVATAVSRPLFSPDRRPPATAATARPSEAPLPRLTGTLVTAAGRSAIFAGGAAPLVLQEGGQVGGFTVRLIEPGQVTLIGPDGPRIVQPSFDADRPRTGAAAPRRPTPGSGTPPRPGAAPADPLAAPSSIEASTGASDTAEGAVPFEQNATPSGLDILRNATRNAPPVTPGPPLTAPPPAPAGALR